MPLKLIRSAIILFVLLVVSACSAPLTATIPPSPQPIYVSLSPSLIGSSVLLHALKETNTNIKTVRYCRAKVIHKTREIKCAAYGG